MGYGLVEVACGMAGALKETTSEWFGFLAGYKS